MHAPPPKTMSCACLCPCAVQRIPVPSPPCRCSDAAFGQRAPRPLAAWACACARLLGNRRHSRPPCSRAYVRQAGSASARDGTRAHDACAGQRAGHPGPARLEAAPEAILAAGGGVRAQWRLPRPGARSQPVDYQAWQDRAAWSRLPRRAAKLQAAQCVLRSACTLYMPSPSRASERWPLACPRRPSSLITARAPHHAGGDLATLYPGDVIQLVCEDVSRAHGRSLPFEGNACAYRVEFIEGDETYPTVRSQVCPSYHVLCR